MDAEETSKPEQSSQVDHKLADDLAKLSRLAEQGPVTFGQLVDELGDRAGVGLLVILSFVFLLVPVPGVSTAASVLFLGLGSTAVLGTKLYLPKWIRRRGMSQPTAQKALRFATKGWAKAERAVRPRLEFLTVGPFRWLAGASLLFAIVAFALPIPIPFNNSPPAFCMLLISLGLLGRDGLMILFGHLATVAMWLALYLAGNVLWQSIYSLLGKFGWTTPAPTTAPSTAQAMLDCFTHTAGLFGLG